MSRRSLNYAAEVVDCLDELFRSGGLQGAPPLKLKERIQIVGGQGGGCQDEHLLRVENSLTPDQGDRRFE
jgi:hypothetical protein